MRKYFITIFVLLCFSAENSAQTKYTDSLINWIGTHPKIDSQYIQTLHRISYRLSEKDVKKSFIYYEKVSSLSDSLHFTFGKSLAQINLGILLSNSGDFEAGNNAYFKAVDEAEACKSMRLKAISLNNIGDNYKTLKDYIKCREYVKQAIDINMHLKAWRGVAINYELLFTCSFEEGLYKDAENILHKGMAFALKANESYIFSQYYVDFGKLFSVNKNQDGAIIYFRKALKEASLQGDLKNESKVYLAQSQYLKISTQKKIIFLDSALKIATRTKYLEGVANAAEQLSMVYDGKKNKDSSLLFYHFYRSASDSLFSQNNKSNLIIKESEWIFRGKEIENHDLKELSKSQSKEINVKNILLLIVFISFLFIIIIAVFIYNSIQLKKRRDELIYKQKITETEIQVLRAQMNPHFIFNCLSSINRFILKNETEAASDYLTKFSRLIRTVLNNSKKTTISLEEEIEMLKLYLGMEKLRFKNTFAYKIYISNKIDVECTFIPPLLLQPFAENAVWHGLMHKNGCGRLIIKIYPENNMLVVIISDNGVGRPAACAFKSKSANKEKSLGMEITKERLALINNNADEKTFFEIEDLHDDEGNASGTKVLMKIKFKETCEEYG